MVFKSIDGHLTTIFSKTQKVNSGFAMTSQEINGIVGKFNRLKEDQDITGLDALYKDVATKNQNIAGMLEGIGKQGASAKASLEGVYAVMLQGETTGFKNVKGVIDKFNSLDPSHQKDFANAVGVTNANLGQYLNNVQVGSASMEGYGRQLVTTTAKTIGLKAATMALNAVVSLGITAIISLGVYGISKLISWIGDLIVTEKELKEKTDEVILSYKQAKSEIQDTGKQLEDLTKKYKDLSKGVDNLNNNVSLSSDKYSEYLDICNSIGDMFPNLVQGYDEQGNAILRCKDNVELLIEAYKEAQIAANNILINEGLNTFKNFKNEAEDISPELDNRQELGKQAVDNLEKILHSPDIEEAVSKYAKVGTVSSAQIAQALREKGIKQGFLESGEDFIARAVRENKIIVSAIVSEFNKTVDEATSNMTSLAEAYVSNLMLENDDYKKFTSSTKSMINSVISSLDFDFYNQFEKGDYEGLTSSLRAIVDEFNNLSRGDRTTLELAINAKTQLNNSECTVKEYLDKVNEAKSVIEGFDENSKTAIESILNDDISDKIQEMSYKLSQADFKYDIKPSDSDNTIENLQDRLSELSYNELEVAYDLIQENTYGSWDELMDAVKNGVTIEASVQIDFKTKLDGVKDTLSNANIFDSAIEKINQKETLNFDEVTSLISLDSSLATKFTETAGEYSFAVSVLTQARENYIKSSKESLQADIEATKQSIALSEQNIEEMQKYSDSLAYAAEQSTGAYQAKTETDKAIQTEKEHLNDLNNELSQNILLLGELVSSASDTVSCIEKSQSAISGMEEKTTLLKKAMTEMRDEGKISVDTYAELVEKGEDYEKCLDLVDGKLVINTDKLKDLDTAALKTAITTNELAMAQINASMAGHEWSEALTEEYNSIELATAALRDKLNEYNNTKPDEKSDGSGGSSNDDKPQSIIDFETELARRQHEIKMGRMEEDEAYFDWLEKAYREAYKGLTGYQDDIYKYEEMVYDGRQKLAEDFYNEQKKYHENRVEELESQITVAENKSVDNSGNSLNPSEKFDYIRASYSDLIAENERRINEIMQSGIEGHEDEVKELEKQIEEYADKLQDVFKDEIDYEIDYIESLQDKYNDFIDKRIERYEDEKKAIEDKYDAEIKSIDDTIDALKDKNDATSKAIELKKAEQDLENANQRIRMVYGADGTVSYRQDTDKIAEAQQKVDDLKLDMLIDSLEKQKESKEAEKDAALQTYETMIEDLEQQKKDRDEFFETVIEKLDNINNPKPTEGIDSVINNVYSDPNEANEIKQGLKDVENAVKDGTEQAKDNANEVKKADNKSQSVNSKTVTESNQIEQTSNMDSFMKLLYSMAGKEPDGYERWKRGEYDEGNKLMSNIFSDDAFMGRAMKPFEDAMNSFNETVNKMNAVNATGQQSANITIGDININNPVGDAKRLAQEVKGEIFKEAMMQIPNDAMRIIYKK